VFSQWLSLSTCIIQTVIDVIPAPCVAQATRIPQMLYPELRETTVKPRNKLEEDLFASKSGPTACVSAYVSKMFAISEMALPENKKKSLTAEEMRNHGRGATMAKEGSRPGGDGTGLVDLSSDQHQPPPGEVNDQVEVLLGFARLYSGTIRTGTKLFCVLPKYKATRNPDHTHNSKHLTTVTVAGLYVMMGRELVAVDCVRAGNIFAIKGLEGKVWRSATLCAPNEGGVGDEPSAPQLKDCLVNLGGVNHSVSGLSHSCHPTFIHIL
jgi:ribosome assembly protein 1